MKEDRPIRVGHVSAIDYPHGMIQVTYPDLDDEVTDWFPFLTFNNEYLMPDVGDEIAVAHLSNGQAAGLILGTYWNQGHQSPITGPHVFRKDLTMNVGEVYFQYKDGVLTIHAPEIVLEGKTIQHHTASNSSTSAAMIDHIQNCSG